MAKEKTLEKQYLTNRTQEETALLIIDQALSGKIVPRKGGVFGWIVKK